MASKKLIIRQVKSGIGYPRGIQDTLRALGLKRHQHTVEKEDNPAIRGMIARVHHLVTVEEKS